MHGGGEELRCYGVEWGASDFWSFCMMVVLFGLVFDVVWGANDILIRWLLLSGLFILASSVRLRVVAQL